MNKYRITLMALCMAICTQAKVTLPSFFTDNMVIQQKSTLILPGKAKAGKQVTVKTSWDNRKYTVKAGVDGSFTLQLPTPAEEVGRNVALPLFRSFHLSLISMPANCGKN